MTICPFHDTEEAIKRRGEDIQFGRDDLATRSPLPSAEELAAPFIEAISKLQEAFDFRAQAMEYDLDWRLNMRGDHDGPDYTAQATELVATAERICSIVRSAIQAHLAGDFRSELINMDGVIRALTQSPRAENVLNQATLDRVLYGTDGKS